MFFQYSAVAIGKGVNERIGQKVSKAGYAWINAAVLTMFEWFGDLLNAKDYRGFAPSLKHVEPLDKKIGKRKKDMKFDDDYEPSANTCTTTSSQQPSQKIFERKASSTSNYSESPSSSFEVSSANQIKQKNIKERAMKLTNKNDSEQSLKETSSSEPRQKKMKKKGPKPSGGSEPPSNEAAKSKQPKNRGRKRKSERAESETPSNETTTSEQRRKMASARKASKRFVDESEPMDVTASTAQTSEKKRSRKSSKISDDEKSESPSSGIGPAKRTTENKGKKPKSSE